MAVNKFIGIGNLGKDVEMRYMPDGGAVANFSIGISDRYKDKTGAQKEVTEWVNISAFGRLAEICGEYLKKGQQVYIEGRLKTDKYTKDGVERYSTKIVADRMQMLGSKAQARDDQKPASAAGNGLPMADGAQNGPIEDNLQDDIPF